MDAYSAIAADRRHFVGAAAMTLAAAGLGLLGCAASPIAASTLRLPVEGDAPPLDGAGAWLNSSPLAMARLRGKVVLVNFWTYTCINWLRTLPYVRAWAAKYKDSGLVVIGVHTPEFPFEHDIDNVRRAVKAMRVDYPVAIDNDYKVWRAFDNNYWPASYFIDAKGRIRHHQFGEGEYDQSETILQQLLLDAGASGIARELAAVEARGIEAPADWSNLRSPENYVGHDRTENFSSPGGAATGKPRVYAVPDRLSLNHWAVSGDWTVNKGNIVLNQPNGRIAYGFHARDVHLVMGPAAGVNAVRFRVLIDGQPAGDAHGADVGSDGSGSVTEQRLYQLIRQPTPIVDRQFAIEFLDAGVEAFAFTFG